MATVFDSFYVSKRYFQLSLLFLFILSPILIYGQYPLKWKRFPAESEMRGAFQTYKQDIQNSVYNSASANGQRVIDYNYEVSSSIKYHGVLDTELKYLPMEFKKYMISGLCFVEKLTYTTQIKGVEQLIDPMKMTEFDIVVLYYNENNNDFYFSAGYEGHKLFDNKNASANDYLNIIRNNLDILKLDADSRFHNHTMYPGWATDDAVSTPESSNRPDPPEEDNDGLWTIIIGGLAAIAAGAGVNRLRKKRKEKEKPNKKEKKEKPRYILNINKNNFELILNEPQELTIDAYKEVDGVRKRVNANISIKNPEKALKVTPSNGSGSLKSQLILNDLPQKKAFELTVNAIAEGRPINTRISIEVGGEKQIIVELLPDKRILRPNLKRIITCYTKVVDERGDAVQDLTKEIEFKQTSDWVNSSESIIDEDWKVINIDIYDPDANAVVSHPPKSISLSWIMDKVPEGEAALQKDVEIQLLDCKIDTDVDTHELSFVVSEQETSLTFSAFIEDCDGSEPWSFSGEYKTEDNQPDEALTTIAHKKINDSKAEFTISGPLLLPKEKQQYLRKKLIISAYQKDEDPLERHLYVYVVKEGLYINKGLDSNDQMKFLAKGDVEKDLEFSLYCYNKKTKQLEVDKEALKFLNFELLDESLVAQNIDTVLQTEFSFDNFVTTIPRARYLYSAPLKFPGIGDFHELTYSVSANVDTTESENPEAFQKNFKLLVQTYGIGNKFPAWREAYKNCKTAIYLVPESQQRQDLLNLLEKHKNKLDIEGMVEYRRKIWMIAHDLMINKRDGYLAIANWHTAVIETLEWVVWMGDLAFQVVVSTYLGPFTGFTASAFKDIALTGYKMAIEGKSVDEYVDAQLDSFKQMIYSATKGRAINTQTIEKYYKGSKVKVWAIYAVATFSAAYLDVRSIPEAAKITARQLRDEAIIRFLSGKVQEQKAKQKADDEKAKKIAKKEKAKKVTKGQDDYERANEPPDVSGYTSASMKAIQRIANKLNIKIITRPTNAAARRLLKAGKAVAKKMFVKNKTISDLDTYLGAKKNNIGKVGSFEPKFNRAKMKNLSPAKKAEIFKRYKQRRREWKNQADNIKKYKDKLYVEDGVVYDKVSRLPFTGDIDIYDIRGPNGEQLTKAQYKKAVDELVNANANVEHGAHVWWEWWKGSPEDVKTNKGIYKKIKKGHAKVVKGKKGEAPKRGEALVEFGPGSGDGVRLKTVFHKGAPTD